MNDKNINKNSTQSGRSMIEMLGVLAIVGVLSVGGIAGYSKAMTKFKINKTADQISQIVTNIRTLYAQQTTYSGLRTVTAIQMGVTPDELGTGTTLTNAFGGSINIEWSNKNLGSPTNYISDDAFAIIVNGMPKEACVSLATMDWGTHASSGLIYLAINSGNRSHAIDNCTSGYSYDEMIRCSKDGPIPVSIAAEACNCSNNDCNIALKFY